MSLLTLLHNLKLPAPQTASPPAAQQRGDWLRHARRTLDAARPLPAPALAPADADAADRLLLHQRGVPVWALLLERCPQVHLHPKTAAILLFSTDNAFVDDPSPLNPLADWLRTLKSTPPADIRTAPIADMLRCHWTDGRCISLPLDLAAGAEVYLASAGLPPFALPPLDAPDPFIPLLVMPDATGFVSPLPPLCWPSRLW